MMTSKTAFHTVATIVAMAMVAAVVWGQTPETVPEAIARGASGRILSAASGRGPSTADVLRETEMVVRGIVREPRGYISEDALNVYTEYRIIKPLILYSTMSMSSRAPAPVQEIAISQIGGTLVLNGHTFTQTERHLPLLEPDTEVLLLLKRVGSRWHLANKYFGAFAIADGRLTPLGSSRRFGAEFRDVEPTAAVSALLAQLHAVKQ